MRVIESAEIQDLPKGTRSQVEMIVKNCGACQLKQGKPRRFLFSIRDPIVGEFNHIHYIDVAKLSDGNVLHAIDLGTGFQSGTFISQMDGSTAWRMLRKCWINIYAGAPDVIHTDAGTNFNSKEFKDRASEMGSIVKIAPTEGHERIGTIERSHATLRAIYDKLRIDLPSMRKEERLSMSFRAINDVPNAETGISPTTLVFGVFPKIPGAGHRGDVAKRAHIIQQCTKLATAMKSRRMVKNAMRVRNVPSITEMEKVRNLPPGHEVIVYREGDGWSKYVLVRAHETSVDVILPSGKISTFALNVVRPYYTEEDSEKQSGGQSTEIANDNFNDASREDFRMVTRSMARKLREENSTHLFIASNANHGVYRESRMEEIEGLQKLGCFEIVSEEQAKGYRLYRPRFVDVTKPSGVKRSRLCVAACNDQEHGLFTAAPTIKRLSLRLLLAVTAIKEFELHTRDVTKAFVMSRTPLRRPVYLKPPSEMQVEKSKVLKVIRPLYGMPESPIHWFKTYSDYHRDKLGMTPSSIDPCLLHHGDGDSLTGIIGLQVDDTIFAGSSSFLKHEEKYSSEFPNKGKHHVTQEKVRFNGVDLTYVAGNIVMEQAEYITNCAKVKWSEQIDFEKFRSLRAKYAYAAFSSVPETLVYVAILAQFTERRFAEESEEATRLLRKMQRMMHTDSSKGGLKFVHIPEKKVEVVVCIDASFATNKDKSSQLGVLAMLRDSDVGTVNIVHYTSSKSKRVCKSALAAELFAFIAGFDIVFTIRHSLERMFPRKIDLTIYTDSHSLYGLCISLAQTTERRLQIDLALIREAYERREITNIIWIEGKQNPADDLTKPDKQSGILHKVIAHNHFKPSQKSWVKRDELRVSTTGNSATTNIQK